MANKPALILFVFFLLLSFNIPGQVPEIGIAGGLSVSQVDGDPYQGYYKAGFHAGVFASLGIGHYAGVHAELKYIEKGSSDGNQIEGTNTYYRMILHYLEMPVLFRYAGWDKLRLEIGPGLAYLVSGVEKDEYGLMLDTEPFHKFELCGIVGINYKVMNNLALGFRFSYSLLPIREHAGGGTWYLNRGQYNNVFSFGVFYRLFPRF